MKVNFKFCFVNRYRFSRKSGLRWEYVHFTSHDNSLASLKHKMLLTFKSFGSLQWTQSSSFNRHEICHMILNPSFLLKHFCSTASSTDPFILFCLPWISSIYFTVSGKIFLVFSSLFNVCYRKLAFIWIQAKSNFSTFIIFWAIKYFL
jgi:hypothetical protein